MNSVVGKGEEWKGESKHLIFYVRVSSEGCKEKKAKACCRLWVPKFAIVSMTVLVCMEKGSEMGKVLWSTWSGYTGTCDIASLITFGLNYCNFV